MPAMPAPHARGRRAAGQHELLRALVYYTWCTPKHKRKSMFSFVLASPFGEHPLLVFYCQEIDFPTECFLSQS